MIQRGFKAIGTLIDLFASLQRKPVIILYFYQPKPFSLPLRPATAVAKLFCGRDRIFERRGVGNDDEEEEDASGLVR